MSDMKTRIVVLGCGGSGGVPYTGNFWGKCDPNNPKNQRTRPSLFIQSGDTNIVIDTGPDFRTQINRLGTVSHLDAVFYTHAHLDHTAGADDLRSFWYQRGQKPTPVYADEATSKDLRQRFDYVFTELRPEYPVTAVLKPLGPVTTVGNIELRSFDQIHGKDFITKGFRIGDFAYATDVKELPEESLKMLEGIHTWIVGSHHTEEGSYNHAGFNQIKQWATRLGVKMTHLTHLNAMADHDTLCRELPPHIRPAFDGLEIRF